jgi:L-amino acid N-acyltransferase YncA
MEFSIRQAIDADSIQISNIFNHYIENTFTAYPDEKVGSDFLDNLTKTSYTGSVYVIATMEEIIGFGLLKKFHPSKVFNRAAEIGYFIH